MLREKQELFFIHNLHPFAKNFYQAIFPELREHPDNRFDRQTSILPYFFSRNRQLKLFTLVNGPAKIQQQTGHLAIHAFGYQVERVDEDLVERVARYGKHSHSKIGILLHQGVNNIDIENTYDAVFQSSGREIVCAFGKYILDADYIHGFAKTDDLLFVVVVNPVKFNQTSLQVFEVSDRTMLDNKLFASLYLNLASRCAKSRDAAVGYGLIEHSPYIAIIAGAFHGSFLSKI